MPSLSHTLPPYQQGSSILIGVDTNYTEKATRHKFSHIEWTANQRVQQKQGHWRGLMPLAPLATAYINQSS